MLVFTSSKDQTMKPLKAEKIIKMIKDYGLNLNLKTGGAYIPHSLISKSKVKKTKSFLKHYEITHTKTKPIFIIDPSLFLKSVTETEDSLKVTLFS